MNVCLVNNIFPPILTGSSLFTLDLATQLCKHGHNVIVITSKTRDSNADYELHPNGFGLFRIDNVRLFKSNLWMNFPNFTFTLLPSNYSRIIGILRDNHIEIIHQCNNIFDMVFLSALCAKKLKLPLICSLMTQIQHSNKSLNKILEIFDLTVIKYLFSRHVDCYIAGDKETERYIKERYNRYKNVETVHYGISGLEQFSCIERDYSQSNNVIVSLGHVSHVKDRKELIESWPKVLSAFPSAKIRIIGSLFSKQIKSLINRIGINSAVDFTGRVERELIPALIMDADIGCMFLSNVPYQKGVGSANIELMASGLPVILDVEEDNFGKDTPFRDGVHFIKLHSRDPEWLADKITELLNNPPLRESIGKAGQKFVTTELTWERVLPMIVNLYDRYIRQIDTSHK